MAPVTINAKATNLGELNKLSKKSLPNTPIIPVIIVTIKIKNNNLMFFENP